MKELTINFWDNDGNCHDGDELFILTEEQFTKLQKVINAERLRRQEERESLANGWTNKIRHLCEEIEKEGFQIVYDGDEIDCGDIWVRA